MLKLSLKTYNITLDTKSLLNRLPEAEALGVAAARARAAGAPEHGSVSHPCATEAHRQARLGWRRRDGSSATLGSSAAAAGGLVAVVVAATK